MDMKQLIGKMDEIDETVANEAYGSSRTEIINILGNLRKMAKQSEHGGELPPGFANRVVNDLWDVIQWLDNLRGEGTNESAKPDFLDLDKDGDKEEPMSKAVKDKDEDEDKEKVDESLVVQADGAEAEALLGMLKLAGMTHQHEEPSMEEPAMEEPAMEERDIEYDNTPNERTAPYQAAVPAGNDLNKAKTMTKHGYRQGDNPLAMAETAALESKLRGMFESMIAENNK